MVSMLDPQDMQGNFQVRVRKVVEIYLSHLDQLEYPVVEELKQEVQKSSLLSAEIQEKSNKQLNAFERIKFQDLEAKIERKQSKISDLKTCLTKIEQYREDQILRLERYFSKQNKNHPMFANDGVQSSQNSSKSDNFGLIQQLYLQIQDFQVKIKNLELDLNMKEVIQAQLDDQTQRRQQLEVQNEQLQSQLSILVQKITEIEQQNQNLKFQLQNQIQNQTKMTETITSQVNQQSLNNSLPVSDQKLSNQQVLPKPVFPPITTDQFDLDDEIDDGSFRLGDYYEDDYW